MTSGSASGSQARYRSLFDQHPDGVYEFDLRGRFVDGNDALASLTGYPVDELLDETFLAIVHPDDADRVIAAFHATLAGETRTYEARILRKQGGTCHVSITSVPIVAEGEVTGFFGIARDISEARRAQQALEQSEARVRQMFDSAGVGVAMVDFEGRLLRANPAFQAMTGLAADTPPGRDLWPLLHPDDVPRVDAAVRLLLETERPSVAAEARCVHEDGHSVWLRASLTLIAGAEGETPHLLVTTEDVTSLLEVDERLSRSRSLVRMAGEIARLGGWHLDVATGEMRWSEEIHDVLGVPRGTSANLETSLQAYPPEHRERAATAIDACAEKGTAFDLEVEVEPRPGHRVWVRVSGEPEYDHDGAIVGVRGALQDVDQQKQAEAETRELAERLTDTLESTTDAVFTVDGLWRITYMNSHAAELLQQDRKAVLGHTIWEAFPNTQDSISGQAYRRVARTGAAETIEEYRYEPLGTWFELNVYPSADGIAVYFRDITAQRETRRQLREREARNRQQALLLDRARDAIIVRDEDGRITYWNHSAERLYGWSAQEARGRRVAELVYRDPDTYAEAHEETMQSGAWAGEAIHVDRTGRELVVEARWTLVRDEEAGTTSVMGINTDVTERRNLEAQFLQAQRMESLGTLASGIAHDLNNAFSPVLMAAQLLSSDEDDPDQLELLEIITASTQRGAEMVQRVLSFARGIEGNRVAVDLASTLREVQRLIRDTFPKTIAVSTNVEPDLWPVTGDPTQLHQVLLNLCVNARDAMPKGGSLAVSLANLVVEGGHDRPHRVELEPGPYVRLTVSDTGEGMTREVLDRAFEPFYTTKSQESGTGLGLSTSLGIIQSHGGEMEAHSRPGLGTIFTIDLPATPGALNPDRPVEQAAFRGNGELVLLVDDEPAVRQLAAMVLRRAGYRVVVATDGLDAIEQGRRHADELALVVTDMMMPHLDGATAVERIRDTVPDVPVVVMSGLRAELERDASRLGTVHLLRKPFTTPELLEVTAAALRTSTPA